jgi:SAM-dependent methyltransferase
MTEPSSHAAFDLGGRRSKAEKIRALLEPWLRGRRDLRLLEIGTGSGAIAHFFSRHPQVASVDAVDVRDQRVVHDGYRFHLYDGGRLPFADAAFDVLVSNHVIEHVGDRAAQLGHLREMRRVLAEDGVGYLATPSRWQLVEPHFRLAGLSWLPRPWRDDYVRLARRGQEYDCDPFSHRELEAMLGKVGFGFENQNANALSATLALEGNGGAVAKALGRLPPSALQKFYRWSPTMVYLVRRGPGDDDGRR